MVILKCAAVALAALVGGSAPAMTTCQCPPETETISCLDGTASFANAVCAQVQVTASLTTVTLTCPVGETAISGGFRHVSGPPRPLLDMSPVSPGGGHANRYFFTWRNKAGTDLRVYITCQRD